MFKFIDYKQLRALRAYHGFSQKDIERNSCIPIGTLSGKERGTLKFDLEECRELGVLYQMTPNDFNQVFLGGVLKNDYSTANKDITGT